MIFKPNIKVIEINLLNSIRYNIEKEDKSI